MKITFKFYRLAVAIGILALLFAKNESVLAQTTNVIPTNIFLTDDGFLFWYGHNGKSIAIKKIQEAENSEESRPAAQDPKGHWGQPSNGFQLSLRFEKQTFTNGEPIDAVMLIRNVTNQSVTYFRPPSVIATKDGNLLKRKDENEIIQITMPLEKTLFPQTQRKYQEHLDQIYDLTQNGEYIFQAVCSNPEVSSDKVTVIVKKSVTP